MLKARAFVSDSKKTESKGKLTMLHDTFPNVEQTLPNIYRFDTVESTMDTARELIPANLDKSVFAVEAKKQTKGRATRNRTWVSDESNLYLTIVLKMKSFPFPLTLIPLRMGSILEPLIQSRVYSRSPVHLKWPNDVLIGAKKVCGMLIEIEGEHMLIGIGCNVMAAPIILETGGPDAGRPATCLAEHSEFHRSGNTSCLADEVTDTSAATSSTGAKSVSEAEEAGATPVGAGLCSSDNSTGVPPVYPGSDEYNYFDAMCEELSKEITYSVHEWYHNGTDSAAAVVADFEKFMDFSPQVLRKEYNSLPTHNEIETEGYKENPNTVISIKGEEVEPVKINTDGTLVVRLTKDGTRRTLVADYLW